MQQPDSWYVGIGQVNGDHCESTIYREGYWNDLKNNHPDYPFPQIFDDKVDDFIARLDIILSPNLPYKKRGFMQLGHSECRICGCMNGYSDLFIRYDSITYIIPEGLMHYYKEHNVHPSEEFREFINNIYDRENLDHLVKNYENEMINIISDIANKLIVECMNDSNLDRENMVYNILDNIASNNIYPDADIIEFIGLVDTGIDDYDVSALSALKWFSDISIQHINMGRVDRIDEFKWRFDINSCNHTDFKTKIIATVKNEFSTLTENINKPINFTKINTTNIISVIRDTFKKIFVTKDLYKNIAYEYINHIYTKDDLLNNDEIVFLKNIHYAFITKYKLYKNVLINAYAPVFSAYQTKMSILRILSGRGGQAYTG